MIMPWKAFRWCAQRGAIALSAAAIVTPTWAQPDPLRSSPATLPGMKQQTPSPKPGETVPQSYIVVFKPGSAAALSRAREAMGQFGGKVVHVYTSALLGLNVQLPREPAREKAALDYLRNIPEVAFIEQDTVGSFYTIQPPNPAGAPPTGLDRIDRRLTPLNGTYTYSETGAGVNVYVIDSGMRITHTEFSGRAVNGFSVVAGDFTDCINHGTHVAGTIGGETFGVAKDVNLINVRVGNAACVPTAAGQIAGMDWVAANRVLPAVANLSLGGPVSNAVDVSIGGMIASGVVAVVAAGNNNGDACMRSPGRVPAAITVGSTVPATDARSIFAGGQASNFGTCLDLFAPGSNIMSASRTGDAATATLSGTSMAAPHVAGVAARFLQTYPTATPAQVWAGILNAANTAATIGWGGVTDPQPGSPNVLLHWGSLNDGVTDGDPHIRTVDGVNFDFQSAGEFTLLRNANGLEIQTRQSPVSTQPPIPNAYTGLSACVSLNSALAARVGGRRVTWQPEKDGNSGAMTLRVDGAPTAVPTSGIDLGPNARISRSAAGNGINIDFPDGTGLTATSHFWGAPHNRWYLNVSVFRTPAYEGVMGAIPAGSWLPGLPNNAFVGPKPAAAADRWIDLYDTFANAWRVTDRSSLFDYSRGESTATFTMKDWPRKSGDCKIPTLPMAAGLPARAARQICSAVRDKNRNANCVFDVMMTGEKGFAEAYLVSEQIERFATRTTLGNRDKTLVATVAPRSLSAKGVPAGTVRFLINGKPYGESRTDKQGVATLLAQNLKPGKHQISAEFKPESAAGFLPSSSGTLTIVVGEGERRKDR